jgi:hypothetical protein
VRGNISNKTNTNIKFFILEVKSKRLSFSRFFTWFPFDRLEEDPIYNINWFVLQECGDFTWRVSDCEELVGIAHRRWWGGVVEV